MLQDHFGFLPSEHLVALADWLKLSVAEVHEVASFYHHFDITDGQTHPPEITIRVCDSISCAMAGGLKLAEELRAHFPDVRIQEVSCVGRCDTAPVAVAGQHPIGHANLKEVAQALSNRTLEDTPPAVPSCAEAQEAGAYAHYMRLRRKELDPQQLIDTMEYATLRGLGGAGFPAARKWQIVRNYPPPRLLAVNIDEGEPGTFKDRYWLEREPHAFLEGMLMAAHLIEAQAIYIYIRDEYTGVRLMLEALLQELRESDPDLPVIELRRGAGAYICGEESAMIESIEGHRGMPRLRPPFIAETGLFGQPTLEHNMETLMWIPKILEHGADWYRGHGRRGRHGLRSFSLSGRIQTPGVHLAPAGISVRELIEEYGGGMLPNHKFYGYFPGGASGGILPASLGDLPLDFDTMMEHNCFLGSGAVIVLSDSDRARDAARNAMKFFSRESCGKCTPCRVGTSKAHTLMQETHWDSELLNELSVTMRDASICGLGQAAPNPLQSVLRHFPDEV